MTEYWVERLRENNRLKHFPKWKDGERERALTFVQMLNSEHQRARTGETFKLTESPGRN